MKNESLTLNIISWIFGLIIMSLGILNLIYIHPVPGLVYLLLSLLFFPPLNSQLKKLSGFAIPFAVRILLFLVICWFTMGISDLGEWMGF